MNRVFISVIAFILVAGSPSAAQTAAAKTGKPAKAGLSVAQRLEQMQNQLQEQQAQISGQQDKIGQLEQQLQQSNSQLQQHGKEFEQLQGSVQRASEQAAVAEKTAAKLDTAVADIKADATTVQSFRETQKVVKDLEHPTALRYKGITLTPGGYLDVTILGRSRNMNSDIIGNFAYFPFDGVANSSLSEFRMSARQTRFSLLTEGNTGSTKLTGYYELDFLGQAPTANQVQTNSFTPRQRQLWGQAEFKNGLTLTAGQMWSLITTDRKGIATRAEFIPMTIEGSYVVGWDYVRQTAVRITKNFNNKAWAAFELANPETTMAASYVPPNLFGFNNSANAVNPVGATLGYLPGACPAAPGFQCNPAASAFAYGLSTNLAPDIIAKAAFEPGWGHYEVKALGRFFRDRIDGNNNISYGGGIGAAAILPVVAKKADFIFEGLVGSGIGRYGATGSHDVTVRPDGKIIPLHALHLMGGVEFHPQPKLDTYVYGGDEYTGRAAYVNPTNAAKPAGYGSPLVNNANCGSEVLPTEVNGVAVPTCGAQNKHLYDITGGFCYRFYKGPFGALQYGTQLEYLHRTSWSGIGGAPQGSDIVGLTSIRYILP